MSKQVPVLVPPNTVGALAYIANPVVRSKAEVDKDSPFLFANTGKKLNFLEHFFNLVSWIILHCAAFLSGCVLVGDF